MCHPPAAACARLFWAHARAARAACIFVTRTCRRSFERPISGQCLSHAAEIDQSGLRARKNAKKLLLVDLRRYPKLTKSTLCRVFGCIIVLGAPGAYSSDTAVLVLGIDAPDNQLPTTPRKTVKTPTQSRALSQIRLSREETPTQSGRPTDRPPLRGGESHHIQVCFTQVGGRCG